MTQSLFDIIGPIMVGPSSSHTAGAVRLGLLAKSIAQHSITTAQCTLYNSFAQTYKGHGTDKGLIAGLLGFNVDDARIKGATTYLASANLKVTLVPTFQANHYPPNTVVFYLTMADQSTLTIVGHSVGGGKVYVSKINDANVILKGDAPTLLLFYKDQPGMIWKVTKVIAQEAINIASLTCTRKVRDIEAHMTITLDSPLSDEGMADLSRIEGIFTLRRIMALPQGV
jgi:L-serine dehydratase